MDICGRSSVDISLSETRPHYVLNYARVASLRERRLHRVVTPVVYTEVKVRARSSKQPILAVPAVPAAAGAIRLGRQERGGWGG